MIVEEPTFEVIEGGIANTVQPTGYIQIPYPNGKTSNDCRSTGHQFILNNQNEYDDSEVTIQLFQNYIRIVNNTANTWREDDKFKLGLNLVPITRIDGDVYIERNLFVGGAAAGGGSGGGYDVTAYGAKGDGVADDYPAILQALNLAKAASRGRELYFPDGEYHIKTAGVTGILLDQVSNFVIRMSSKAKLIIDNMVGGVGVAHGILIKGPCENIHLLGCDVRYKTFPSHRQNWSPIAVVGANVGPNGNGTGSWYRGAPNAERPDLIAAGAVRNISILGCHTENSPSVMIMLAGFDGLTMRGFTSKRSWADGVYQIYGRHSNCQGITLTEVADDACSFSSYESDVVNANIDNDFHCEGSVMTGVIIDGYYPDKNLPSGGIVYLGVRDVTVDGFVVRNKFRGIRMEIGTALSTVNPFLSTLANRNCIIANGIIHNCFHAFASVNKEVGFDDDDKWWRQGVTISNVRADSDANSPYDKNYPISVYGDAQDTGNTIPAILCGVTFDNCTFSNFTGGGNGGNYQSKFVNCTFNGSWGFSGYVPYRGNLQGDYPENNCDFVNLRGQDLSFIGLKKCRVDAYSENAQVAAIAFYCCADIVCQTLSVKNTNRALDAFPGAVVVDDLSYRITGDLVILDQDEIPISNALSINNKNFCYFKRVIVKTDQNTYYRSVFDKRFSEDNISQVGSISWYHTGVEFPKWNTLDFLTSGSGIAGNVDFDYYPETSPKTFLINFPITAARQAILHHGASSQGDIVEVIRTAAATGAFNYVIVGQAEGTPAVIAIPARATFLITGGTYSPGVNQITEVRVNGVNILPAPINWGSPDFFNNSNDYTAFQVFTAIHNAFLLGATYDAQSSLNLVSLESPVGATYNGYAVAVITTGDVVASDTTNMAGGLDAQAEGATPAPYTVATMTAAGQGYRVRFGATGWEPLSKTAL